jgi:hypothetical protein
MVRETFGQAVDDALAQLEYAGVPRDAVAVIRQRLRRDKAVGAAALDILAEWDRPVEDFSPPAVDVAIERLRAALHARERVRG